MAGEASHVRFAVPEGAIDSTHHNDHSARGHLLGLCVSGPIIDVAVAARSLIQKAQRLHEGLHGGRPIGSLEHLDVFGATTSPAAASAPTASGRGATCAASATSGSRDSESAGSPGQILGNERNLLIRQTRTDTLHASDAGGPRVTIRFLVVDAIERVARGADRVHEVRRNGIWTLDGGSRALGRLG